MRTRAVAEYFANGLPSARRPARATPASSWKTAQARRHCPRRGQVAGSRAPYALASGCEPICPGLRLFWPGQSRQPPKRRRHLPRATRPFQAYTTASSPYPTSPRGQGPARSQPAHPELQRRDHPRCRLLRRSSLKRPEAPRCITGGPAPMTVPRLTSAIELRRTAIPLAFDLRTVGNRLLCGGRDFQLIRICWRTRDRSVVVV